MNREGRFALMQACLFVNGAVFSVAVANENLALIVLSILAAYFCAFLSRLHARGLS